MRPVEPHPWFVTSALAITLDKVSKTLGCGNRGACDKRFSQVHYTAPHLTACPQGTIVRPYQSSILRLVLPLL